MLNKITQNPSVQKWQDQAKVLGNRLADHHISLAVTGLSKSGKTAFITSLINQLINARDGAQLPFLNVVSDNRLIGVKREVQPDVTVSRFAYEQGMENLSNIPPLWPNSTNGVSQVRLLIKYKSQSRLRRLVSQHSTLTLDITDYPGEWLLDLPLLETDYQTWCERFWEDVKDGDKATLIAPFKEALSAINLHDEVDEMQLQSIALRFTEYLHACKDAGYQLIQPGRFVLPGELDGAPVLQFFPLSLEQLASTKDHTRSISQHSPASLLQQRFEQYQSKVVKPFYKKHFKRFDRQIILVDCLSALNLGAHSFNDLKKAINWLLGSFHYGRSNILKRIFAPNIDKLIFAASKSDHITPDQQPNLVKLLESIVHEARQHIHYEGVATESTAFSAIRTTSVGQSQVNGKPIQVLSGAKEDGSILNLYPGDVPSQCPEDDFWDKQGFSFPNFMPKALAHDRQALPHIRIDHILQFVLGDKLE
ncbi:MAG: YcjX family protein [Aliiglaciecola sp.]